MSKLLLNEIPLIVLPSLAKAIGVNEAIIIQQIHYWLNKKLHFYQGKYWTYNSYEKWKGQFSFLTPRQIQYAIKNLEEKKLLISGNFNKSPIDRTKWYTINYIVLEQISPFDKIVQPFYTSVKPIPETTTKELIIESAKYLITEIKKETSFYSIINKYIKIFGEKKIHEILKGCNEREAEFADENKLASYLQVCKNGRAQKQTVGEYDPAKSYDEGKDLHDEWEKIAGVN